MADHLIALAGHARTGQRPALEALLRETAGFLHALARARLGDGHDAEVVTADALARIAAGLPRLRDPQAYPHWAWRVLQRCIARRGGRPRPTVDPGSLALEDGRGGPVETAVRVEVRRRVATAVRSLPARLREPVLLHYAADLSYREIAVVLGTGLGTVSRRMRKALQQLRPHLGDLR